MDILENEESLDQPPTSALPTQGDPVPANAKSAKDANKDLPRRLGLWALTLRSFEECRDLLQSQSSRFEVRRSFERQLQESLASDEYNVLPGYCWVCHSLKAFIYDRLYSDGINVNWRERLVCPTCRLNNRLRLSVQSFERMARDSRASIYLTEQVTPLAAYLVEHFPATITSEFLGPTFTPGQVNADGIRHEDVTDLSFSDGSFDFVLSFDVLEHVPGYRAAIAEFYRVLKPGGRVLLSVPFGLLYERNLVRARIDSQGNVEHLLPAEYHGDPIDPNGGVLCYYHFGWELLQDFRDAGFSDASMAITWSLEYGHIGSEQLLIVAQR
jgi:SAM-dependent methyltransferase